MAYLYYIPDSTHSCRGVRATITRVNDCIGRIEDVESCSSCWQTGCTGDSPFTVGDVVRLPAGYTWESAAEAAPEEAGYEGTVITPFDLLPE